MSFNNWVYRVSKPIGGLSLAKLITRNHPKILMYHRIGNEAGMIDVDTLRQHLNIIKTNFNPVTLGQLVSQWKQGVVKKNCVVITFDDGYFDFFDFALPALVEEKVPATVFLTTGFVDGDIWLWPDKLRYAINNSDMEKLRKKSFYGVKLDSLTDKNKVWSYLANFCLELPNYEKNNLISSLFNELEVEAPSIIPNSERAVNWDQVSEIIASGIEVGSHSVSHPILKNVDDEQLEFELVESRRKIIAKTGYYPNGFCYPNGMSSDYDERVKAAVIKAGYEYAVSAFPNANPLKDLWSINRYPAQNDLDGFEKNVYGFTRMSMILS